MQIPLTRGYVALVDAADYVLATAPGKWHAEVTATAGLVYAKRTFKRADGRFTSLGMHFFLTGWELIDHRNGNGLDNRRSNLRQATCAQNMQNRRPKLSSKSGLKGVHRDKYRWRALIRVNGRQIYLGAFRAPEEAARAYDRAALDHYGEFARTNFPRGDYS